MNVISKLLVSSAFVLSSTAHAIVIDGDLKDWIGIPIGSINDWKPIDPTVSYFVEDQSGGSNAYLNPGYGGQAYDAEAIYVKRDATDFYIAVVTGLGPDNITYPAGDLAFDFGSDGSYEYGVVVKSDSGTSNGGIGNKGDVYKVNQWNLGLWDDSGSYKKSEHPTTVKAGSLIGTAGLFYQEALYNNSSLTNKLGIDAGTHYLIEAKISTSLFDVGDRDKAFRVHWTMACANDSISVDPPANVPTPTVLPMLALGLTLLIGFRRNPNQNAIQTTLN